MSVNFYPSSYSFYVLVGEEVYQRKLSKEGEIHSIQFYVNPNSDLSVLHIIKYRLYNNTEKIINSQQSKSKRRTCHQLSVRGVFLHPKERRGAGREGEEGSKGRDMGEGGRGISDF